MYTLIFLAAAAQPALEQKPVIEILEPHLSAERVDLDVHAVPAHHFDLMSSARRLNDANRDDYFRKLDAYLAEAVTCESPDKAGWFLQLAHQTFASDEVRAVVAPRLEAFVLERPDCFLAGLQRLEFIVKPYQVFERFIIDTESSHAHELQAAIQPQLAQPEFSDLAAIYEKQLAAKAEREARAEAQRERQLAIDRKDHRAPLKNQGLLATDSRGYWSLWQEVTAKARTCEDIDAVADLLDTAVMHSNVEGARERSAEFVEFLVIDNPACVLQAMTRMRNEYAFERYLQEPLIVGERELLAPLAFTRVEGEATAKQQARLRRIHDNAQKQAIANSRSEARFVQRIHVAHTDGQGKYFVTPPNPGHLEIDAARLDALWQQAGFAGTQSEWNLEMRKLPLDALEFMTGGDYPAYQMLMIGANGVHAAHVYPAAAYVMEWYCEGKLLLLEIAPNPADGLNGGLRSWPAVLEMAREVPLPEILNHRYDQKDMFVRGELAWPTEGRSMSFEYTDSYTDVIFRLEDKQTGEKRHGADIGPMCH